MILIKNKTKQKLIPIDTVCKYCEGHVIERQTEKVVQILFFELMTLARDKYLVCSSCERSLYQSALKKKPQTTYHETEYANGMVKKVHTQRLGINTRTRTVCDYKNTIPTSKNPKLLAITIIGLMELMEKMDTDIDIERSDNYSNILQRHQPYADDLTLISKLIQEDDMEDARGIVLKLFKECKRELLDSDLRFVLSQALSLTSHQYVLKLEILELFKELFLFCGFGELVIESQINSMRIEWM